MKFKHVKDYLLVSLTLITTSYCYAESNLSIGKILNSQEIAQLNGSNVKLGAQSFKVITHNNSSNKTLKTVQSTPSTFVVNDRGLVGLSQNIVLISEISPSQVNSALKEIVNSAITVKYYDHLNIIFLKFNDLNQGILAREKLLKVFPDTRITIPIKFSEPSVR